jgi:hypothetical protein
MISAYIWNKYYFLGQSLNIILTVMNYTSTETQDYGSTKGGAQQSRGRLTLLSDISETNPNLLLSQQ